MNKQHLHKNFSIYVLMQKFDVCFDKVKEKKGKADKLKFSKVNK